MTGFTGRTLQSDRDLLLRHLPILRLASGERFWPIPVEPYVESCSLHVHTAEDPDRMVIHAGDLSIADLGGSWPVGSYLRFVDPAERRAQVPAQLKEIPRGLNSGHRLTRVGLGGRMVDVGLRVVNLFRPTVPWRTSDAAAVKAAPIQDREGPCCYARAIRAEGWIALHYTFFYAMNDWRSRFQGVNDHEADWEQALVYLDSTDNSPMWVAYASHDHTGSDLRRRWDDPELKRIEGRPVIYVGAGSHASYFSPGEYPTSVHIRALGPFLAVQRLFRRLLGLSADVDGIGIPYIDRAHGDGEEIGPDGDHDLELRDLDWSEPWIGAYRGLWGLDCHDPADGERAPAGPKFERDGSTRAAWADPLGWAGLHQVAPPSQTENFEELVSAEREYVDAVLEELVRRARLVGADPSKSASEVKALEREILTRQRQRSALEEAATAAAAPRVQDDPRAHLVDPATPAPRATGVRERLLSAWATVSAPALLAVIGLAVLGPWGSRIQIAVSGVLIVIGIETLTKRRFLRSVVVYFGFVVGAGAIWAGLRYLSPAIDEMVAAALLVLAAGVLVLNLIERIRT